MNQEDKSCCGHEHPGQEDRLYAMRHSAAHVLAQAVLEMFPDAKLGIGPAIDDGFYYDFDLPRTLIPEDLPILEKKMKQIVKQNQKFVKRVEPGKDAIKFLEKTGQNYKEELVREFVEAGEDISFYENVMQDGTPKFVDLCEGPHLESTSQLGPFKLMKIAAAYWRGDEKNPQLQRIYGVCFETQEALQAHIDMLKEAERRDHRKLGRELEIYMTHEEVGAGLPMWLPNGAVVAEEIEKLAKEVEYEAGYDRVRTPHITKGDLYKKSGHLPYYAESMFPPMQLENDEYYLKPMNCPHHHLIYGHKTRSYRDLPVRLAEYGQCYRFEDSGALFGLMRVRSMCMNDAHIYCTLDQFEEEFMAVINIYKKYFNIFGVEKYMMRLSLHSKEGLGKKYVDEPKLWIKTEEMVRKVMQKSGVDFVEAEDEAAFYGPKIDVEIWSAIGREFTLATNQLDFAIPKRFGLTYVDADGKEQTPLCIHRAPLSTHERMIGFLIEHFAGAFPTWLAPTQVTVLPVSDKFLDYAKKVEAELRKLNVRVTLDDSKESLGKKIRNAEKSKIPWMLVIGEKEADENFVAARSYHTKEQVDMPLAEFLKNVEKEISSRSLPPSAH